MPSLSDAPCVGLEGVGRGGGEIFGEEAGSSGPGDDESSGSCVSFCFGFRLPKMATRISRLVG